ncbi:MAG: HPF/RaiA family ribosome-associated protein [Rhodocyclaceae bacterium]|jgi:ribosome-associated translation inhibitor RaiA|nr:HPF/RaiA family ribosome-associated protein [Rhodocyclaceae bacterium]MDP3036157.1 HPF/RaiA family ribosome-associated protein [Rhodocyclaceae bacterium]
MRVQVQIKGLPGSSRLRRFAAHKLDVALSRFSHGIQDATMQLKDINGADRGGADKLCRIVLTMKNSSFLVIEELASDVAQAIERAVGRLHQNVSRQLSRIVKIDRSGMRQNNLLLADA